MNIKNNDAIFIEKTLIILSGATMAAALAFMLVILS